MGANNDYKSRNFFEGFRAPVQNVLCITHTQPVIFLPSAKKKTELLRPPNSRRAPYIPNRSKRGSIKRWRNRLQRKRKLYQRIRQKKQKQKKF